MMTFFSPRHFQPLSQKISCTDIAIPSGSTEGLIMLMNAGLAVIQKRPVMPLLLEE
jgi:hypothetical protein